ncbi:unnamed protein product [Eruca vesicaria subsp. sativa]|uniref:Uncharacterized protein n=1 Tax=Eruca vesicaria subsp. sativa TaxID=29727 RepID=A0ABC8J2X1_ERUVS|nr:unnamed protein product [Eruca vesicaria subsp. sativa]
MSKQDPILIWKVCVECGVPWHDIMGCEEFQILPVDEGYPDDITLHRSAKYKRWRQCLTLWFLISMLRSLFVFFWCGREFCYTCGEEYRAGQHSCICETFNSMPRVMTLTQSKKDLS